jgi:threonine/homoserine/homoserine lactone efflux protein
MLVLAPVEPVATAAAVTEIALAVAVVCALVAKEAVTSVPDARGLRFGRVLDVVLAPLLIGFGIVMALGLLP